jgi:hypothetical protein
MRSPSLEALAGTSELIVLCHGDASTRSNVDALAPHLPRVDLACCGGMMALLATGHAAAA